MTRFNDCGMASLQGSFRQKASQDCVLNHCLDARLVCFEGSQVRQSRDVSRSFVTDSRLASVDCGLYHALFRENRRRAAQIVVTNFSSSLLLQECGAVHSENVVDTTDTKTLAEESNLCLWVLTQLDTFVYGWNDVWLGQELVRNEMVLVHCNFECGASGGYCGDRGQFLHVVNFPLRRCCGRPRSKRPPFSVGFRSAPTFVLASSNSCKLDDSRIG